MSEGDGCRLYGDLPAGAADWRSLIRARMASAMALSFRAAAKSRAF